MPDIREPWADAPLVFVTIPACPNCGHQGYTRQRTENNGDGSHYHKRICDGCSRRYKVVFELPESGNEHDDGL